MIPPDEVNSVGNKFFSEIGNEFKNYFVELCGLRPEHSVLDVGCGAGRMAIPLVPYLTNGSYKGFDIDRKAIVWCNEIINSAHPNFKFDYSDVHNACYNNAGSVKAKDYKFPYADGEFDFVFLTSVFTHMFPEDMLNYLKEIHRVLKPKGTCLLTYFLFNDETLELIRHGRTSLKFQHKTIEPCLAVNINSPEAAIAYPESYVEDALEQMGFTHNLYYGSWCERTKRMSYQDIIIARKK